MSYLSYCYSQFGSSVLVLQYYCSKCSAQDRTIVKHAESPFLSDSEEQRASGEEDNRLIRQGMLGLLRYPKFHCCVHKTLSLATNLNYFNPVHILAPCLLKISINITVSLHLVVPNGLLLFVILATDLCEYLISLIVHDFHHPKNA